MCPLSTFSIHLITFGNLSVCLFLFIHSKCFTTIYLSAIMYQSVYLLFCLSIYHQAINVYKFYPYICLTIYYLSTYLSVCFFISLYVYLSITSIHYLKSSNVCVAGHILGDSKNCGGSTGLPIESPGLDLQHSIK